MKIGIIMPCPLQQQSISSHLRGHHHQDFMIAERLADLPYGPWPDMVLLADWAFLSPSERDFLLKKSCATPCLALIVIAPFLSGDDAHQLLHSGVADILSSASDLTGLTIAVQRQSLSLSSRRQWLCDQEQAAQILHHLTPREQDILRALHGGSSTKIAARLLGISPRTVEVHRANMLRRTGMASITDLLKIQSQMDQARAALERRNYGGLVLHENYAPNHAPIEPHVAPRASPPDRPSTMRWN